MSSQHVLVLTDEDLEQGNEVPEPLRAFIDHADDVYVVAPMLARAMESATGEGEGDRAHAEPQQQAAFEHMCSCGFSAHRTAEDADPIAAIGDALDAFQADLVVMRMSAPAGPSASWRERHLAERVRTRFGLPTIALLLDQRGHVIARDDA